MMSEVELRRASEEVKKLDIRKITSMVIAGGMCREMLNREDNLLALLAPELDEALGGSVH